MSPLETISGAYKAYEARDFATVFSLFDPNIEIVQTTELPWGGHYRGPDGARQFFARLGEHTEAQPSPETFVPAGEDVVAIGRLRGRARKSGKVIDLAIVHVWKVHQGRITRFEAYIDTPAMLEALAE